MTDKDTPKVEPMTAEQAYKVPDTPETLARWIWFHYVGIPLTEPYDKEYMRLFDRIEALNRQSFVKGLNEGVRQMKDQHAASHVAPPSQASEN